MTNKKLLTISTALILCSQAQTAPKLSDLALTKPSIKKSVKKVKSKANKLKSIFTFNTKTLTSKFASWGVNPQNKASSINLVDAWKKYKRKKDVVVAVVDTGIDPTHPFLHNNIYVPKGQVSTDNFGLDFSKGRKSKSKPSDDHGHGTHVSGIIKSVFPSVKLFSLKYYNVKASGQENLNSTIEALRSAVKSNADIINYSGGGPEPSLEELRILKEAERKGILIVAAAGNEESNIDVKKNAYYPASYGLTNIITVTAHDQSLNVLSSSNYGAKSVDIAAPGYRIKSALNRSRSGYLTGTSQATAFVSGVAALLKSKHPELRASDLKKIINASAKKEKSLAKKCSTGGRLDATKAIVNAANYLGKRPQRALANEGQILYRLSN